MKQEIGKRKVGRYSRLPEGGVNIFAEVKAMRKAAEAGGTEIWNLSIGQPVGSALLIARFMNVLATMLDNEDVHGYQDNGAPGVTAFFKALRKSHIPIAKIANRISGAATILPSNTVREGIDLLSFLLGVMSIDTDKESQWEKECPDFAEGFVQHHVRIGLPDANVKYLPLPGTKPAFEYIILACRNSFGDNMEVMSMSEPGYPTPATMCEYLGIPHKTFPLTAENQFLPTDHLEVCDLMMMNYPNNPSGQIATLEFWYMICDFCEKNGIRLFNDAAYAKLAPEENVLLSEVAVDYPDLSWAESYSSSKMGCNLTGHRVGAVVGSTDFVGDIATIKGNCDSGFYAPAAVGVLAVLRYAPEKIKEYWQTFQRRQELFFGIATKYGMQPVVKPKSTFFNWWELPKKAFGVNIEDSKHFNELVISNTGLIGVHLHPECIRYAVVEDIETPEFIAAIESGFEKADVKY
ncbi:MAG TPA: aminotransferase class I/II-fold pyridoxal phosphate-dependent enzyme [Nitrospirae bacterium]|nr:aminotransferase class I/II-fold pyridoxal phosphate-dependent enzyme [Nitrospirota bacterium]